MNPSRKLNPSAAALESSAAPASIVESRPSSLFSQVPGDGEIKPSVRFSLTSGADAREQTFNASLLICPSPTCSCGHIGFECRVVTGDGVSGSGASAEERPLRIDVDVFDRVVKPRSDATPASDALGLALVTQMLDADWEWLLRYLQMRKREQMETMDLATLDVRFPPDVVETGAMCGYQEVFPWAEVWMFELDGENWFAADHYCVNPDCDCTEVLLAFVRPLDESATEGEPLPVPDCYLYFNYKTGKYRVESAIPGCSTGRLTAALHKAYPKLRHDLAKRHDQLQQLGRRIFGKKRRTFKQWRQGFLGKVSGGKPSDIPKAVAKPSEPKVARNDTCPCGSGKKFKKCCMAADHRPDQEKSDLA